MRSLGGWSEVVSARRRGEKTASDARILGKGEFVEEVFSQAGERIKETLRWRGRVPDLEVLLEQVARREKIGSEEIRGGIRRRLVAKVRRRFCQVAKEVGYSGAAVARFLGVTALLVNRYASSVETMAERRK